MCRFKVIPIGLLTIYWYFCFPLIFLNHFLLYLTQLIIYIIQSAVIIQLWFYSFVIVQINNKLSNSVIHSFIHSFIHS